MVGSDFWIAAELAFDLADCLEAPSPRRFTAGRHRPVVPGIANAKDNVPIDVHARQGFEHQPRRFIPVVEANKFQCPYHVLSARGPAPCRPFQVAKAKKPIPRIQLFPQGEQRGQSGKIVAHSGDPSRVEPGISQHGAVGTLAFLQIRGGHPVEKHRPLRDQPGQAMAGDDVIPRFADRAFVDPLRRTEADAPKHSPSMAPGKRARYRWKSRPFRQTTARKIAARFEASVTRRMGTSFAASQRAEAGNSCLDQGRDTATSNASQRGFSFASSASKSRFSPLVSAVM